MNLKKEIKELKEVNNQLTKLKKELKEYKQENKQLRNDLYGVNSKKEKIYAFFRFIYDDFKKQSNNWVDKVSGIGQHDEVCCSRFADDKNDEEWQEMDNIMAYNYIQGLSEEDIDFLLKAFEIDYKDC